MSTKDFDIILPNNYPEDLQYVFMIVSWDGEIKTNEEWEKIVMYH